MCKYEVLCFAYTQVAKLPINVRVSDLMISIYGLQFNLYILTPRRGLGINIVMFTHLNENSCEFPSTLGH